jgi:hypothetical protein
MIAWLKRDFDIYRCDFGREYGWFVEWQGKRVAELIDPAWDWNSQFWHEYVLVPLTDEPAEVAELNSPEFWHRNLTYENRKYGNRVTHVLANLRPARSDGKEIVSIRSLHVPVRLRRLWEMVSLFLPRPVRRVC